MTHAKGGRNIGSTKGGTQGHTLIIVAIELSEWTFPQSLAPPFAFQDTFDLVLSDTLAGLPTKRIQITIPNSYYQYDYPSFTANSYVDVLEDLLNAAVAGDVDYAGNAIFSVPAQLDERTSITMATIGGGFAAGRLAFNIDFTTYAQTASPYEIMGFSYLDYSSVQIADSTGTLVQNVTSPEPVNFNLFRYVDVNIREIAQESTPSFRIFLRNQSSSTVQNNSYTPVRFLSEALEKPEKLTVDITLPNGLAPLSFAAHDLTFNVFTLSPEPYVPANYEQIFTLSGLQQYTTS